MNFTVTDIPLIANNFAKKRWSGIDEDVKANVIRVIKEGLNSPDPDISMKSADLARKIDELNLKDEIFRTPKMQINIAELTDEELENKLQELENVENQVLNPAPDPLKKLPENNSKRNNPGYINRHHSFINKVE